MICICAWKRKTNHQFCYKISFSYPLIIRGIWKWDESKYLSLIVMFDHMVNALIVQLITVCKCMVGVVFNCSLDDIATDFS